MSLPAYTAFSRWYDGMMHDADYALWSAYLCGMLRERGAQTVVDAACGTGNLTIPLARAGFRMLGVDQSSDMLDIAQQKARKEGLAIPFVCQDMTALSVHRPVDAITCCCDGVNYLTSLADVRAFLAACHAALREGGALLFDVSSAYKLESVLGGETFTEVTDAYAYIWRNAYDEKTKLCQMDVSFFVQNGGRYDRFDERHVQRAHTVDELSCLAAKTGFAVAGVYAAFTRREPAWDSERIQFVLEKSA